VKWDTVRDDERVALWDGFESSTTDRWPATVL
jgi:hypothetical protein